MEKMATAPTEARLRRARPRESASRCQPTAWQTSIAMKPVMKKRMANAVKAM